MDLEWQMRLAVRQLSGYSEGGIYSHEPRGWMNGHEPAWVSWGSRRSKLPSGRFTFVD